MISKDILTNTEIAAQIQSCTLDTKTTNHSALTYNMFRNCPILICDCIAKSCWSVPNLRTFVCALVDRDRFRTATNVLGDCFGVAIVQHLSRDTLQNCVPAEEFLVEENKVNPAK